MSRGAHFNRAARRSGGDRRFVLQQLDQDKAWLAVAILKVRHELGQAGVDDLIAEMRKRGDLECSDEQAKDIAAFGTP